MIIHK